MKRVSARTCLLAFARPSPCPRLLARLPYFIRPLCPVLRRSPGNRVVVVVYPSLIFVVNILIKCRHRTRPTRMRADAWQVYLRDQTSRIAARSLATGHGLRDSSLARLLSLSLSTAAAENERTQIHLARGCLSRIQKPKKHTHRGNKKKRKRNRNTK